MRWAVVVSQVSYTFSRDFISLLLKDVPAKDFGRTPVLVRALRRVRSCSGAGTNLKAGTSVQRKAPEKFFGRAPPVFLALKVQLVVLMSALVMVSTVWSVSCLLLLYSRCLRVQPFVKVGPRAPVPYEVAPLRSCLYLSTYRSTVNVLFMLLQLHVINLVGLSLIDVESIVSSKKDLRLSVRSCSLEVFMITMQRSKIISCKHEIWMSVFVLFL